MITMWYSANSKFPLPARPSLIPNEIHRAINFACVWSLKTQNGPVPVSQMESGSNSRIPVQVLKSNATACCSPVVDEFIN